MFFWIIENAFLSTLSLRRATNPPKNQHQRKNISIHALLAESDVSVPNRPEGQKQFLSTLSLRRATVVGDVMGKGLAEISIHALLAESDCRVDFFFA